jgi:hypothetical protein
MSRLAMLCWASGLLLLAFMFGLVAAGGVYEITTVSPITGQYVISNKISGITWSCMVTSCVKVDFHSEPKRKQEDAQ